MNAYINVGIAALSLTVNLAVWFICAKNRSAQRQNSRDYVGNTNLGGFNPFSTAPVRASQRFKLKHDCWPLLIGQESDGTVWVVVQQSQLPSPSELKVGDA